MTTAIENKGRFAPDPGSEVSRRLLAAGARRYPSHTDKRMAVDANMTVDAMKKARQRGKLALRHCLVLLRTWGPGVWEIALRPIDEDLAEAARIYNEKRRTGIARSFNADVRARAYDEIGGRGMGPAEDQVVHAVGAPGETARRERQRPALRRESAVSRRPPPGENQMTRGVSKGPPLGRASPGPCCQRRGPGIFSSSRARPGGRPEPRGATGPRGYSR